MMIPPAARLAVIVLVGWVLVFSGVLHFVYARQSRETRNSLGSARRYPLNFHGGLLAQESHYRLGFPHLCSRGLPVLRSRAGIRPGIPVTPRAGLGLAGGGRSDHANSPHLDLANMALEYGLGTRDARRDQHVITLTTFPKLALRSLL
jgi:hypothetical protein